MRFLGSSIQVCVKLDVGARGNLRTYELACLACVGLDPKSRWHFVVSVRDYSNLGSRCMLYLQIWRAMELRLAMCEQ